MTTSCSSCSKPPGFFKRLKECPAKKGGCGQMFCSPCLDFALATSDEPVEKPKITSFCKNCFKKCSNLKYSENETVTIVSAPNPTKSIVFVHGGGGCRYMFLPHAKDLVTKGPYKCILLDLPGHGVKMDDTLTLDTAIETVVNITKEHAGTEAFYVGGSLGGYIGMEILGRHPTLFKAAILMMCGQNTGVGAGIPARLGLWGFRTFLSRISSATLLSGLVSAATSNGNLMSDIVFETSLRTGAFFHQGEAQVKILSESNPKESLAKFKGRVLFINGSKDHRDSEKLWCSLCNGTLIVYEQGDHFFSHDKRFYQRLLTDITQFLDTE